MGKFVTKLVVGFISLLVLITANTPSACAQQMHDSQDTFNPPALLTSCGNVDFYYQLSILPGTSGKQHARITVTNKNNFPVRFTFKVNFESDAGDTFGQDHNGYGVKAKFTYFPSRFEWIPFEDANGNDYPQIYKMGMSNIEVRNWDDPENGPDAYSRGRTVETCNGQLKVVGTKKAAPGGTAGASGSSGSSGPHPIGCWTFTYADEPLQKLRIVFKANGEAEFIPLTNDQGTPYVAGSMGYNVNHSVKRWISRGSDVAVSGNPQPSDFNADPTDINSPSQIFRFDGSRLRNWYYNDKGDSSDNIRYYGVKDATCNVP